MSLEIKYRPEIDGLRAVAVLSVMCFHGAVPGFSGGFVGVDVFFVISGFLITGILLKELQLGHFSLAAFYERRARRIMPALFLVLLFSVVVGWFVLEPYSFRSLGSALIATVLFGSNILFWRVTSYFADAFENPLLHTWSLGVEEQFYLFFPLFLLGLWKFLPRRLGLVFVMLAVISLCVSLWALGTGRQAAAFYLLPSRAFELLLGSMAAWVLFTDKLPAARPWAAQAFSIFGLFSIFLAIVLYNKSMPFPGWRALLPTFGALLIILYAGPQTLVGRLLGSRPMVAVGLISYSAYLWHQPVFVFFRAAEFSLTVLYSLALILFCLLLAWLSWRFVEQPFRKRNAFTRGRVFWGTAAASTLGICVGAALVISDGVKSRYTADELRWYAYADTARQSSYVTERFDSLSRPFDRLSGGRKIVVIGDSFAQDFTNMYHETGAWRGDQVRTVYIPSACQITLLPGDEAGQYIVPAERSRCARESTVRKELPLIRQADVVVMAANWKLWSAERLPITLASIGLREDQKLFVIGSKEFGFYSASTLLQLGDDGRASARHRVSSQLLSINEKLRSVLPSDVFVDQIALVCDKHQECPVVTEQDDLISYDGKHLTAAGAAYIGRILFGQSVLAEGR